MLDEKLDEALHDRVARNAAVLLSGTEWEVDPTDPPFVETKVRELKAINAVLMALEIEAQTQFALGTDEAVDNYV